MALNGQEIIHYSMEKGMGIISYGQDFSILRISSAVREWSLLVTGCSV
jgi:hypothetical protein